MSWIDKELKRRADGRSRPLPPAAAPPAPPAARLKDLWSRIEQAHDALPGELRLTAGPSPGAPAVPGWPPLLAWYRASNDAVLGLAADGIRYLWPHEGRHRSHNFWIRWDPERTRFVVTQRIGTRLPLQMAIAPLAVDRVGHMVKCLVLGRRITMRSVRRKRLGIF